MTRNSQDDLFITQYLSTKYITFLLERLKQECARLEQKYLEIDRPMLSEKDNQYICSQIDFHYQSAMLYSNFLLDIQKKISDFYEENQTPMPFYATEAYHKNIKEHEERIMQLIHELFKNEKS